jgi:hypothetical protein
MQMDLSSRKERLDKKRLHLQELLTQQISFKNLIKRNREASSSTDEQAPEADRIPLPFIIASLCDSNTQTCAARAASGG